MRQEPEAEEGAARIPPSAKGGNETLETGRQAIPAESAGVTTPWCPAASAAMLFTCPSCSVSLTYHRANGRLMCHYCGHSREPVSVCPECGSDKVAVFRTGHPAGGGGTGTFIPRVSIFRMDTDTTMSRFAYEKNSRTFSKGKYGLMIGTQMVAKGWIFPSVGLVGCCRRISPCMGTTTLL